MDYTIGQEILTSTVDNAAALPAVGDTGHIMQYGGIEVAAYKVTKVDPERRLIWGVIVSAPMAPGQAVEKIKELARG